MGQRPSEQPIVGVQWGNLVCSCKLNKNRFSQPHCKEKDGITLDKAPAEMIVINGPHHGACDQPVFAHG